MDEAKAVPAFVDQTNGSGLHVPGLAETFSADPDGTGSLDGQVGLDGQV